MIRAGALFFSKFFFVIAGVAILVPVASGQSVEAPYARKNSLGILAAYSPNSSHMLLGAAEKRKIVNIGVSYSRRLYLSRMVSWQYDGEFLPVALEGDPLAAFINWQTEPSSATYTGNLGFSPIKCTPVVVTYNQTFNGVTYSGTQINFCHGRQWSMGQSMSPVGFQWNFIPGNKLQPVFEGHGGYMYSSRQIPQMGDGSFNFTFDLGAGIEFYRSHTQSMRVLYRYHHISNHNTANANPGIDSGVFQLSYVFGR